MNGYVLSHKNKSGPSHHIFFFVCHRHLTPIVLEPLHSVICFSALYRRQAAGEWLHSAELHPNLPLTFLSAPPSLSFLLLSSILHVEHMLWVWYLGQCNSDFLSNEELVLVWVSWLHWNVHLFAVILDNVRMCCDETVKLLTFRNQQRTKCVAQQSHLKSHSLLF